MQEVALLEIDKGNFRARTGWRKLWEILDQPGVLVAGRHCHIAGMSPDSDISQ